MANIRANMNDLWCHVKDSNPYGAAKTAQFTAEAEKGVKALTSSEKGLLGRIADLFRVVFGMKGAPGSVADLKYCMNQLKKNALKQLDILQELVDILQELEPKIGGIPVSNAKRPRISDAEMQKARTRLNAFNASVKAIVAETQEVRTHFTNALNARVTLLNLPCSDKMRKAYATQLRKNALGSTLDDKDKIAASLHKLAKRFTTEGYSTKTKVAIAVGVAAAALAAYEGYQYFAPVEYLAEDHMCFPRYCECPNILDKKGKWVSNHEAGIMQWSIYLGGRSHSKCIPGTCPSLDQFLYRAQLIGQTISPERKAALAKILPKGI